jgi:hypothetical protein
MTATTLRAEPAPLTGLGRSGGDAQELAATNPVAALPCARTPLLDPLSCPLLHPCLAPHQRPWGWTPWPRCHSGWWGCPTPAGRAQRSRATGRGLGGS